MRYIFSILLMVMWVVPAHAAPIRGASKAVSTSPRTDAVLFVEGLNGTGPGNSINLQSFSFSMERSAGTATGRAGAAAQFGDLVIRKKVDGTSPDLALLLANGRQVPTIRLEITEGERLYEILLWDCVVVSLSQNNWREEVGFHYNRISWSYRPDEDAAKTGRSWNVQTNRQE